MHRLVEKLWDQLREKASHWIVGGVVVALTGFGPEEWFAHLVHSFNISDGALHLWGADIDFRVVPVTAGMASIAVGVFRRKRTQLHASADTTAISLAAGAGTSLSAKATPLDPNQTSRYPPDRPEVLSVRDIGFVTERLWTGVDLLTRLIELDYMIIDGLDLVNEGSAQQWAPVFMNYPDTWRLVVSNDKNIVGYWHFVPLDREMYLRALNGELLDSEITEDTLRYFGTPGLYDIYYVSVGIHPSHRNAKGNWLLLSSFLDVVAALAEHDVWINSICTLAFSRLGEKLCEDLKMRKIVTRTSHGEVYECTMIALLGALNLDKYTSYQKYNRLIRLYAYKFG
jgi:hypothetical protein